SLVNNIPTVTNDSGQMFEKNPQIRISTEINRDNQVVVRIADNGLGICPAVQSKMFDPFFTTKPVGSGTGLGLSISYQIVKESHGGELMCHSEVGQGAEFAIALPISQNSRVRN
ncbi:MAG: ATP-binding protein, partial [Microcoleus sp.]